MSSQLVQKQADGQLTKSSSSYHYYQHKQVAVRSPRFEQTDMQRQPNPTPAIDLIAQEPVRHVNKRIAVCDGGGGPTGHPRVYINLDQSGSHACGYCGIRFEQEHHH
ncbi:hypothetical protein RI367_000364 [Sorochytrium milnesiophthora]